MVRSQLLRAIILGAAVLTASCESREDRINGAIASVVEQGHGTELRMETVAPFAWDRFYAFEAMTSPEEINRTVGGEIATASDPATQSDGYNMLIFAQAGRPVAKVNHVQRFGDFSQLQRDDGWAREDAVFRVDEAKANQAQGRPWRRLLPVDR